MKFLMILVMLVAVGCGTSNDNSNVQSASGIKKATAKIATGSDGLTTEQRNVKRRLEVEGTPGNIKHLYIISAYSGQAILYSTVEGKVTSSGKRLTPTTVSSADGEFVSGQFGGFPINIGGDTYRTGEVLQDDGTYGSSVEYLFWFDTQGRYHQHYVSGGQIVHIADQPMPVKNIIINVEEAKGE